MKDSVSSVGGTCQHGYAYDERHPKNVIIGHSTRWPDIIKRLSGTIPGLEYLSRNKGHLKDEVFFKYRDVKMKYAFSPEGTIGVHTLVTQNAFLGARNIINIGCVGGINHNLEHGSQVICNSAIRNSGFGKLLVDDDEEVVTSALLNKALADAMKELVGLATLARVWCVDTLYYTFAQLQNVLDRGAPPDVVEMEIEAGALTAGWLNFNFFPDTPIQYAQLGYVSDKLPDSAVMNSTWQDPFLRRTTKNMVPWKERSFELAINAFVGLH